ncbi:hypothetical protein LOTGIDRAFT_230238 [Lottia gigantea]|uniref:GH18 domain-containing protein n=1 Tax=Lottia gigantea TaxID=225164 RepID=V4B104_LOTGI|nr:hypothetical protein LOTGIDRAFT_230238 [Lottia gigantea]ESP03943.1 hypothetical protein LOTGIDRAFT_230238 [Lottia gigantea]
MKMGVFTSGIILGLTWLVIDGHVNERYKRVCYFPSWKQYKPGADKFSIDDLSDPSLCTHIVVAFAGLNSETFTIKPLESGADGLRGSWRNITRVKILYPNVNILLAIGGYNYGSLPFSKLVETDEGIKRFAENVVPYLRTNLFDGLDIDWEYPGQKGSPYTDRYRYTKLLKKLYDKFDEETTQTGSPRLLLSLAVSVDKYIVDEGYEVRDIARYVDFVNLMTYDMYGDWANVIGHHSALYGKPSDTPYMAVRNVNWVVSYWIKLGMPAEKLVVGIPFYGRSFAITNHTGSILGSAFTSAGIGGPFTSKNGLIGAFELCQILADPKYRIQWDYEALVPSAYSTSDWIGYDDQKSIRLKCDYVKSNNLGGVMVWDISLDDFSGAFCHQGKFPLLREIKRMLAPARKVNIVSQPVLTYRDYYRLWLNRFLGNVLRV